ncbi:MAG: DMT family transporter [Sporolactobacillus sp.]
MTKNRANLLLLIASIIWGSGFVVLKFSINAQATPGFINFFRGSLFALLSFIFFRRPIMRMSRDELKIGLTAGVLNSAGFLSQTIGVAYTTPSRNAFISSAYVVIIPFVAWLLFRQKLQLKSFLAIALCIIGMAVLTGVGAELTLNRGDFFSLLSAFFYAGSIVLLSHAARGTNPGPITFMLASVQAAGGLIYFLFEGPGKLAALNWSEALWPLLYISIFCSFIGQAIQVSAQKYTTASSAGLIMMLEGVFGSLFSIAFGFDQWSLHLLAGGLLITSALVLMETDLPQWLRKHSLHPLHMLNQKGSKL